MSARANTPDVAKAMEELEAQMSPKARELQEPVAQEEVETYHTRREGPRVQKKVRERRSTTRAEASTLANPDEFRIEEDTVGEGRQEEKKTKTLTEAVRRSSHPQGTNNRIVSREKEAPPNSGLSAYKLSQGGGGKGRDGCHNTRGTKTWKNPVRSSQQGSHRQPTTGASVQPEQGGR